MLPLSPTAVLLLIGLLCVYYRLGPRAQRSCLLVASLVLCWSWSSALVIGVATMAVIDRALVDRVTIAGRVGSAWLAAGIVSNVAVWLAARAFAPSLGPVVGLSFVLLRSISYLVDARTGSAASMAGLLLYLAYFPALIAGPIERAQIFDAVVHRDRRIDDEALADAATLIVRGLVRKLLIADPLVAFLRDDAFLIPAGFDGSVLAWNLVGYWFFLYNDFAGYTDVARGISALFGIPLPPNFVRPFFARSVTDFWTRWHASFMRWLRDYVYFPTSRMVLRWRPGVRSIPNMVIPPLVVMLASGLWHGGTPALLLWGALHGTYLAGERLAASMRRGSRAAVDGPALLSRVRTLTLCAIALVPFRAPLAATLEFWVGLVAWQHPKPPPLVGLLLVGLSLAIDATETWLPEAIGRSPGWLRAAALATVGLLIVFAATDAVPRPFVYQGF